MQSENYDKAKSVKMIHAVQFIMGELTIYLANLFEGLDLDMLAPNYLEPLPRDLVLVPEVQNDGVGIASRLISGGIWVGKKMF